MVSGRPLPCIGHVLRLQPVYRQVVSSRIEEDIHMGMTSLTRFSPTIFCHLTTEFLIRLELIGQRGHTGKSANASRMKESGTSPTSP